MVAPVVAHELAPAWLGWTLLAGSILLVATLASAQAWRLGRDAASLATLATGLVAVALIGYGALAPTENAARGHRQFAAELTRALPPGAPAWFFDDLDEGLWFYAPDLDLRPVPPLPDSPDTNRGHALRPPSPPARPAPRSPPPGPTPPPPASPPGPTAPAPTPAS